jgi:hypothetical protein
LRIVCLFAKFWLLTHFLAEDFAIAMEVLEKAIKTQLQPFDIGISEMNEILWNIDC